MPTIRASSGAFPFEGLTGLTASLAPDFQALERFLEEQVEAFEPAVQPLVRYTFQHSGKKIRPLLVFLSAWKGEGQRLPQPVIQAAAIVELVHLATLVHDDILDRATLRHRTPTLDHRYGSHTSVLLGDALFAHALELAARYPTSEVCRMVARATREVCSGEIAQTFARGQAGLTRQDYDRIIRLKTGELFAVSAWLGAFLAGYPPAFAEAAEGFALRLGIAYQVYDDAADLISQESQAGKTLGTDLESGKLTLPLMLLLQRLDAGERQRLEAALLSGQVERGELGPLFHRYGVMAAVQDAFAAEVEAGRRLLLPFAQLPAAHKLPVLADFIESAFDKLNPAVSESAH